MNEALSALRHGLRGIATFSGRDGRSLFWWYAVFMVGTIFLVFQVLAAFFMMPMMSAQFAVASDSAAAPQGVEAPSDFQAIFDVILTGTIIMAVVTVVVMAAAIARRLRDAGLSPWLGLIPLVFLVSGFFLMAPMFNSLLTADPADVDMTRFGLTFLNNLLYLLSLAILVTGLCRKSKPS